VGEEASFEKEIRGRCLQLLTRREHSQQELLNKLALKGIERNATQAVIDKLIDEGWQSDERYAESYARYRIKKGFGPIKIAHELKQKGISHFDLEPVVHDISDSWFTLLTQVYHKKYADKGDLSPKEYIKRSRFLLQRGFSHEMINSVLK